MKQANVPGRILRPVICSSSLFAGCSQKSPGLPHAVQVLSHCTTPRLAHLAISEATEKLLGPSLEEKKGEVGTNGVLGGCVGA